MIIHISIQTLEIINAVKPALTWFPRMHLGNLSNQNCPRAKHQCSANEFQRKCIPKWNVTGQKFWGFSRKPEPTWVLVLGFVVQLTEPPLSTTVPSFRLGIRGPVAKGDTLALIMPVPAERCHTTASACLVPPAPINTHQPGVATSLLYSGSQFRGYQKSKGNAYEVEVAVQVNFQTQACTQLACCWLLTAIFLL